MNGLSPACTLMCCLSLDDVVTHCHKLYIHMVICNVSLHHPDITVVNWNEINGTKNSLTKVIKSNNAYVSNDGVCRAAPGFARICLRYKCIRN